MRKILTVNLLFVLLLLCGCGEGTENKQTQFLLDTIVKITASCDEDTLKGAFELCAKYEKMFSRTIAQSDVYKLNEQTGFTAVNKNTVEIIKRSLYYSEISQGKFDITICPVSELWDFKNQIIPSKNEIAEALQSVDYNHIEIKDNTVNLNGSKIDLGGVAKGYIADRIKDYFIESKVKDGVINLGGNVLVLGDKLYTVGIQKPFSDDLAVSVKVKNKSVVTSGSYQRYIEADGKKYHHILDPKTGYPINNGLSSVTIISDDSFNGDCLSTVSFILGEKAAADLIEKADNTEAVFINTDGDITYTSGLVKKNKYLTLK